MTTAKYDIIFAGGGASACVTAGRLAKADPTLKILIIEDGPDTRDKPIHVRPALFLRNFQDPASKTFLHHRGRPSQSIGGRSPVVDVGRCLGGGSCVNFMMYTRAAASDYDDWETVYKNPGWGSKDLIPLLQKAETFDRDAPYHGKNGPIKVSYRESDINIAEEFLNVAKWYDKKRSLTDDVNGFFSCNAYGVRKFCIPNIPADALSHNPRDGRSRHSLCFSHDLVLIIHRYVDPKTGTRSSAAQHYIYNQIDDNQNLEIMCEKKVIRVLFEGTRATGVEYIDGPGGKIAVAKASRLVVLSAGAFGSPTILQRSGVGSASLLKEHNIPVLLDLPGVGEHYMDHNIIFAPYLVSDDADTLDVVFRADEAGLQPFVQQWLQTGTGLLTHNGIDAGIKIRPTLEELTELGQDFKTIWEEYYIRAPDKPVMLIFPMAASVEAIPELPIKKYMCMIYYTAYPVSLGFVHISSGNDAYAPVDFHPGFLDKPADLAVLRWAYKRGREFTRRMKMYRGEHAMGHPKFPNGSAAECRPAEGPVNIDESDINYSEEDDAAIDRYHRANVASCWHSIGTCAMKPREDQGVVDSRLNVYGTQNLKIADCSIAPGNVGANTYNTAIAIGEKAAVLIAEDLGIKGIRNTSL
ncbi:hypothetical protein APHAL10511_007685 [Amanita phalloides]|nr:hypothetical protein APHAL10511_007685 [Amanita phalloides]